MRYECDVTLYDHTHISQKKNEDENDNENGVSSVVLEGVLCA